MLIRYEKKHKEMESKKDLKPGEDDTLEARRKLLQNSEKLSEGLQDAAERKKMLIKQQKLMWDILIM